MDAVRETVRHNLARLFERTGRKQKALADACGVSPSAVTNWINGRSGVDLENIPTICDFFGITVGEFLGDSMGAEQASGHSSEEPMLGYSEALPANQGGSMKNTPLMHAVAEAAENSLTVRTGGRTTMRANRREATPDAVKEGISLCLKELFETTRRKRNALARACGVSAPTVTNWVNGRSSIDIECIPTICEFFGLTVDEFFERAENLEPNADVTAGSVGEREGEAADMTEKGVHGDFVEIDESAVKAVWDELREHESARSVVSAILALKMMADDFSEVRKDYDPNSGLSLDEAVLLKRFRSLPEEDKQDMIARTRMLRLTETYKTKGAKAAIEEAIALDAGKRPYRKGGGRRAAADGDVPVNPKAYMGRKIREFRRERGLTQADLGAKLTPPKSAGAVSSWESGRTFPDYDTHVELCKALHVDIGELWPPIPRSTDEGTGEPTSSVVATEATDEPDTEASLSPVDAETCATTGEINCSPDVGTARPHTLLVTDDVGETVRRNVEKLFELSGKKRANLADACGISSSVVTDWVTGVTPIGIERVPAICDFFGVTTDALFGRTANLEAARAPAPDEGELVEYYQKLPSEGKAGILKSARLQWLAHVYDTEGETAAIEAASMTRRS